LPATHIPAFTQGVTAIWLVLIAPTHEGTDRLSWPWVAGYINIPHQELNPDTVTHPSTNRTRRRYQRATTMPDHVHVLM